MITNEIDLHYGALMACIFNTNLSMEVALNKMGVPTKLPNKSRLSINTQEKISGNIQNIKEMYLVDTKSMAEIGREYGVAAKTIRKCLIECDVDLRVVGSIKGKLKGV